MILDEPFATREDILSAFRPGAAVQSDASLKTLRKREAVSGGIPIVLREDGRFQGRRVLYSSLCIHAARLSRHGIDREAAALARVAQELEAQPVALEAAEASVRGENASTPVLEMALLTEEALMPFRELLSNILQFSSAVVDNVAANFIVLSHDQGYWPAWRHVIPDFLAHPGTAVTVVIENLGQAGVLMNVRPAVWLEFPDPARGAEGSPTPAGEPVLTPLSPRPSQEAVIAAAKNALASLRAEGLSPSPEAIDLALRMASGELTPEQVRVELRRLHEPPASTAAVATAGRASGRGPSNLREG